ncbi:hypothetical protein V8J82_21970 [Gymnodinialimonas sp. 2305UL16-5]|uniref:ATP-grasp domain-containing protein n=1 Tax=Gymnodinialimonas mytili TaxID=3126503 RepID=UPI0030AE9D71
MNSTHRIKVLLIGSSFSAMPMLVALKRQKAHVTVIGQYQTDPCHAYADASIFEDYSDWETLLRICRSEEFDYIVPSCNDYSYLAAAKVAAELGFAGLDDLETTHILHTKDHFRRFCADIGIPAPKIFGILDENTPTPLDKLEGPAILKPVDSFSGRGIQILRDIAELPVASEKALAQSRRRSAVIEEYVEGSLHSHTAFVVSGRIIWHDFVDEFCEVYPYQVDRSIYPSRLDRSLRVDVQSAMETLVAAMNLKNGLLHTQFMASGSSFWIIECMRRCPGDLYGHHFKLALNYDYEANYVAGFIGRAAEAPGYTSKPKAVQRKVISVANTEAFFGISMEQTTCQSLYIPLKDSGLTLEPAPFDKAGILFSYGEREEFFENVVSDIEAYPDIIRLSVKNRSKQG